MLTVSGLQFTMMVSYPSTGKLEPRARSSNQIRCLAQFDSSRLPNDHLSPIRWIRLFLFHRWSRGKVYELQTRSACIDPFVDCRIPCSTGRTNVSTQQFKTWPKRTSENPSAWPPGVARAMVATRQLFQFASASTIRLNSRETRDRHCHLAKSINR